MNNSILIKSHRAISRAMLIPTREVGVTCPVSIEYIRHVCKECGYDYMTVSESGLTYDPYVQDIPMTNASRYLHDKAGMMIHGRAVGRTTGLAHQFIAEAIETRIKTNVEDHVWTGPARKILLSCIKTISEQLGYSARMTIKDNHSGFIKWIK